MHRLQLLLGRVDLLLFSKPVVVGAPHPEGQPGHRAERDERFPELDDVGRDDEQGDRHPEVREERVERRDEEGRQVVDLAPLPLRQRHHAHRRDHVQVERGRANDCARAKVAREEPLPSDLDDREQDLRR
eukprot:1405298-Rhodomonas_salina.1